MLTVRAVQPPDERARLFDALSGNTRMVSDPHGEYLLLDRGGGVIRLDVMQGTTAAGSVTLHFDLADDDRLEARFAAIGTFRAAAPTGRRHERLARRLYALQAVDARDQGASLRETADLLLGPGDWPGDGEHRKSYVRRLLDAGSRMIRSGPCEILNTN